MGTSLPRSTDAALKAPVKAGLLIAQARLDVLVHHGADAYADALDLAADESHNATTKDVLGAVAIVVRRAAGDDWRPGNSQGLPAPRSPEDVKRRVDGVDTFRSVSDEPLPGCALCGVYNRACPTHFRRA